MCVEKLIKMVKSKPILYDTNNSDYKNVRMKEKIWQDIGEELGQDCETVKRKWRNMRDSYIKYLKSTQTTTIQSARRYRNWQWAKQMESFKPYFSFTITIDGVDFSTLESNSAIDDNNENEWDALDVNIHSEYMKDADTSHSDEDVEETPTPSVKPNRKRPLSCTIQTSPSPAKNKVFGDFKKKCSCEEFDAAELIFLGYAKTLKTFSLERQAKVKLQIANIIMQQEIKHLREQQKLSAV